MHFFQNKCEVFVVDGLFTNLVMSFCTNCNLSPILRATLHSVHWNIPTLNQGLTYSSQGILVEESLQLGKKSQTWEKAILATEIIWIFSDNHQWTCSIKGGTSYPRAISLIPKQGKPYCRSAIILLVVYHSLSLVIQFTLHSGLACLHSLS